MGQKIDQRSYQGDIEFKKEIKKKDTSNSYISYKLDKPSESTDLQTGSLIVFF